VFDADRYWDVEVSYAKASPTKIHVRIEAHNRGPGPATCTCCRACGSAIPGRGTGVQKSPRFKPSLRRRAPPGRSVPITRRSVITTSMDASQASCFSPGTRPMRSACGACPTPRPM
jgi:hypothetical protein